MCNHATEMSVGAPTTIFNTVLKNKGPSLPSTFLKIKAPNWNFHSDNKEEPLLVPQRTFH